MKILIIGGTQFIGKHIVEALIAQGDEVTLFHRGRTNPGSFPQLEHRIGDRNSDLSALEKGSWDATIDTSAYLPNQVRTLHDALGTRGGHYVHISSVSAYTTPTEARFSEDWPLQTLEDPNHAVLSDTTYGPLKAACERCTLSTFGGTSQTPVSIVRPTVVVGPFDHTERFTWWVKRVNRGGKILAPDPRDNPVQLIDVRDLADFVTQLCHGDSGGTYHVASPTPPFSMSDLLQEIVNTVGPEGTELVWYDPAVFTIPGQQEPKFPLWTGTDPDRLLFAADPSRALSRGMKVRPLTTTITDVLSWATNSPSTPSTFGLSPEVEEEILNKIS